jgi:serine carboxypeptidase-like clade 1
VCEGRLGDDDDDGSSAGHSGGILRRPATAFDSLWWQAGSANKNQNEVPEHAVSSLRGPIGCIDQSAADAYLNDPAVKAALHMPNTAAVGNWSVCGASGTGSGDFQYHADQEDERKVVYPALLAGGVKVLIFNGDADACVPYNGNEAWTKSMGLPLAVNGSWHAWKTDDQVSGYATAYEQDFTFVTVKGAGHMVPQYKPVQALDMLDRFIHNKAF